MVSPAGGQMMSERSSGRGFGEPGPTAAMRQ
jgi:hypothetical protein